MPPITVRSSLEKIFATGQTAKQPISFGDFFFSVITVTTHILYNENIYQSIACRHLI